MQNHIITAMIDVLSVEGEWEEGREVPPLEDEADDCVVSVPPSLLLSTPNANSGLLSVGICLRVLMYKYNTRIIRTLVDLRATGSQRR